MFLRKQIYYLRAFVLTVAVNENYFNSDKAEKFVLIFFGVEKSSHCSEGRQYFWNNNTSQMEHGLISSHLLRRTGNFQVNSVQAHIPCSPRWSCKRRRGVSDIRLMFLIQLLLLKRSLYLRGSLLCFKKKNFPSPTSLQITEPSFKLPSHTLNTSFGYEF